MRIIAGCARNLELHMPPMLNIRPTAGRSRKALFDSLGDFCGAAVLDLCSGSGALALEAVSRGAAEAVMVELIPAHCTIITENIERVRRTGAVCRMKVVNTDAGNVSEYSQLISPDVIFADPPYAVSAELFASLIANAEFRHVFSGARMVWELPDTPGAIGTFMPAMKLKIFELRRFGGTDFIMGEL